MYRASPRHGLSRPRSLRALLLSAVTLAPVAAWALGLGRPQTVSALGQPLNLVFPVQLAAGEALTRECVRAEVLAGDARVPPNLIQLRLEGASETSVRAVRLQSVVQIDEPLVTVQLSLGCPASFTRQFTAFIDPPGLASESAVAAAPEATVRHYTPALQAALSTSEAKSVALLAASPPPPTDAMQAAAVPRMAASAPRRTASAASAAATLPANAAADQPISKPRSPRPSRTAAATAKKPTARLQLEPAEVLAAAPPASAPPLAAVDTLALERLTKLEQAQQKMQADHLATQQQLVAVQQRLAQAQSARYQNPLVYGLGLLSLLMGGLNLYLWGRGRSERQLHGSAWWDAEQGRAAAAPVPAVVMPSPVAKPASGWGNMRPDDERTLSLPSLDAGADEPALMPVLVPVPATPFTPVTPAAAVANAADEPVSFQWVNPSAPEREKLPVTVEELIDLEQQIDFFVVLGQDDAAIQLLQSRVQGGSGAAALPHLKLLELLQRHGDAAGFESVAARYVAQFGGRPPGFSDVIGGGAGLEAHPQMLSRLQLCWRDSGGCMALLQGLLTDRQPAPASSSSSTGIALDLQTHLDLLLLYGVARDLSEHEVRGDEIDLFLPLESPASAGGNSSAMMATMHWQAPASERHDVPRALEVDISLDDPEPLPR
jgi:pilus assembly protein FimV